jgi:hypothetical protein
MRANFLRWRLARQPLWLMLAGVGMSLSFAAGLALFLWDAQRGTVKLNTLLSLLILSATGSALGMMLTGWAAARLARALDYRHRDLRALGRYGPPSEVVAAIDAEVLAGRRLVRLGTLPKLLSPVPAPGELRGHQVILTESWLLDFWRGEGDRFNAMRLADIVWASREHSLDEAKLALLDRHDVPLKIIGTPAAVGRLLAEVLGRVPWVLERFDPEAERAWGQDRTGILADVDRRREQFRRGDQSGTPTTPA